jgi:cell division septation protein DedD
LFLVLVGAAIAVGAGLRWLGASATAATAAGGIALFLGAALALILSRRAEGGPTTHTEPIWPYVGGRSQAARMHESDGRESVWAVAVIALMLGMGSTAVALFLLRADDDEQPAGLEPTETASATASPTVRDSPTPTLTPSPEPTATPSPTEPPATATPERSPPTATPTATPREDRETAANLSGTWEIVDVVEFGQDEGATYRFVVTLNQDGSSVAGSGDGLVVLGRIDGNTLTADYVRPGGTGVFEWTVAGGGDSFAGSFQDFGAQNGGRSSLSRVR